MNDENRRGEKNDMNMSYDSRPGCHTGDCIEANLSDGDGVTEKGGEGSENHLSLRCASPEIEVESN